MTLKRIKNWRRGTFPLLLGFFSLAAFLIASGQFNRQRAIWSYVHHPNNYSLADYKITSAYTARIQRQKSKRKQRYVRGLIGDKLVTSTLDRTGLSVDMFNKIKDGHLPEYSVKVLYAPQHDTSGDKNPTTTSIHVVESSATTATLSSLIVDIAVWNLWWLLGIAGLIASYFHERRQYAYELDQCMKQQK